MVRRTVPDLIERGWCRVDADPCCTVVERTLPGPPDNDRATVLIAAADVVAGPSESPAVDVLAGVLRGSMRPDR